MSNDAKLMKTVSVWKVFSTKIEKIIRILFFSQTMIELIITVLSMIDNDE
jgi:hypothetical protein